MFQERQYGKWGIDKVNSVSLSLPCPLFYDLGVPENLFRSQTYGNNREYDLLAAMTVYVKQENRVLSLWETVWTGARVTVLQIAISGFYSSRSKPYRLPAFCSQRGKWVSNVSAQCKCWCIGHSCLFPKKPWDPFTPIPSPPTTAFKFGMIHQMAFGEK